MGEDLIAEEAKYHNSCRRDYVRQDTKEEGQKFNRKKHDEAFQKLSMFLVIKNKAAMLATIMFSLYKEEFLAVGGTLDDMNKYSVQSLMSKVNERFEDILIDKLAKKSGTFVFYSSLTASEVITM